MPKRAPLAAAAAPAAPGVGPAAEEPAWVKLCLKNEQTANKHVCLVNHEGLTPTPAWCWSPPRCARSKAKTNRI